jgi:hypothetical protein
MLATMSVFAIAAAGILLGILLVRIFCWILEDFWLK